MARVPPTLRGQYGHTTPVTNTGYLTPNTISVTANIDDRIVVMILGSSNGIEVPTGFTLTGGGIAWSQAGGNGFSSVQGRSAAYVGTATATGTFTLSVPLLAGTPDNLVMIRAWVFYGSDGIGANGTGSGALSASVTTSADASAIVYGAVDGSGAAFTLPYLTGAAGAATADAAASTAAVGTFAFVRHSNTGTAGAKTVGVTGGTTAHTAVTAVEVKGHSAADVTDGVPFLAAQLGASSRLQVQVAWGADLSAASSTWTWSDITDDVRFSGGINLRHGRSDEAGTTQPAACDLALDNSAGAYSLGGQSVNWPNVKQNTPVRVRVDSGTGLGWMTLFLGYADSWTPTWDQSANVATVQLTASGILRRLQQNTSPILSSLRRQLTTESNVVAYWPLEEGANSRAGLSAFDTHPAMGTSAGTVNFAADTTSFASTVQMPVLKNGSLAAAVPRYPGTGKQQVRALMAFPDNGLTNGAILMRVQLASATLSYMDIVYGTGGTLEVNGYRSVGSGTPLLVIDGTAVAFGLNGTSKRLYFELEQSGTAITWRLGTQSIDAPTGNFISGTLAATTLGYVSRIDIGPGANIDGLAVGHVVVQNAVTSIFTDYADLTAFEGESAYARFMRVCAENGIASVGFGDGVPGSVSKQNDLMGPQRPADALSILRAAEAVSDGILYDGLSNSAGLVLWLRQARENASARLAIRADALASPLVPTYDDQGRINKMVTTRTDGGSFTAEDVDGSMGTATVGIYDASETLSVEVDESLADHAWWAVSKGTFDGYRHPVVELDLAATPTKVDSWISSTSPGRHISVTDVKAVIAQYPADVIDLEIQGFRQTLTPHSWRVSVNCAPFEPWRVFRIAEEAGDVNVNLGRLDTDGSVLATAATSGATSLSVGTVAGPLWTTKADDFPLQVLAGGILVTVSAITGTASPQTFTVTAIPQALAAGVPIQVYRPAVLAL